MFLVMHNCIHVLLKTSHQHLDTRCASSSGYTGGSGSGGSGRGGGGRSGYL